MFELSQDEFIASAVIFGVIILGFFIYFLKKKGLFGKCFSGGYEWYPEVKGDRLRKQRRYLSFQGRPLHVPSESPLLSHPENHESYQLTFSLGDLVASLREEDTDQTRERVLSRFLSNKKTIFPCIAAVSIVSKFSSSHSKSRVIQALYPHFSDPVNFDRILVELVDASTACDVKASLNLP
eukprot:c12585_g1_i1.p1 GENE.c12585_g1_i1~~c12585_g1_i1.p1  ORF type:complete len:181 (+),score=69.64 c12585_g1_i1:25-567(+)